MKPGDKVDILFSYQHSDAAYLRREWSTGWTLEFISGDWVLVMKEEVSYDCSKRFMRKKVEKDFIRLSSDIPDEQRAKRGKLPLPGASVMFKVPNSYHHDIWTLGLVVRQNKKSIKVLHNNELINRNFPQFIEVTNGEH
jgi:hypothetical protein